jgi:SOS response associated peptidase (SRAP)
MVANSLFLWGEGPDDRLRMINAKTETITARAFREAIKYRRCLVPADALCEWVGFEGAWARKWAQRNIRVAPLSRIESAARWLCWSLIQLNRCCDSESLKPTRNPNELLRIRMHRNESSNVDEQLNCSASVHEPGPDQEPAPRTSDYRGSPELLRGWLNRHELSTEQKVVGDLQSSRDGKWKVDQARPGEHESNKRRRMAAPIVRATPVIPAAADRSSGRTTAIV